jgi:transcriptional regulator with XRE-family HTH domain
MADMNYSIRMMDKKFLDTFGKRVYYLRKDAGYSTQLAFLAALENVTGVQFSQPRWSGIESGDDIPNARVVAAIATLLNTTTDFLLMRTDDPFVPGEESRPAYITPEAEQVAAMVDEIRSELRRAEALSIVRAMLEADEKERMVEGLQEDLQAFTRLANILEQRLDPDSYVEVMREFRRLLGLDSGRQDGTGG